MPNMVRDAGFGVCDTVKGMVPGHTCIVQVGFTQRFEDHWFEDSWFKDRA